MSSEAQPTRAAQRREREREARVACIRAAGARVFARQGYAGATMEAVADEAELGKATLYYYFKTKRDLFAEILAHENAELERLSREQLAQGADGLQVSRAICEYWIGHFQNHPALAALMLPIMASGARPIADELGAEIVDQIKAAHAPLMQALAGLVEDAEQGRALAAMISTFLLGLIAKASGGQFKDATSEIELFFKLVEQLLGRNRT